MPCFAGTSEFELIVAFQSQITSLVSHRRQAAEHQSLIQQLQLFRNAATLDRVDRQALNFVALPPEAGYCGQQSHDTNRFQSHQLVDTEE